jgi:hypothetical protein
MAGAKPGPNLIHGEIARAAIHATLNNRTQAHELLVRRQRTPAALLGGTYDGLGLDVVNRLVAIGLAYTVDAYSGGLRGHCTFYPQRTNEDKKQTLAARQQKSLIQPPGNPTNGGRLSILGRNTLVQ